MNDSHGSYTLVYEKCISANPSMELEKIGFFSFTTTKGPLSVWFLSALCFCKVFCPWLCHQSFDLESALHRTLFTAALCNELKRISVLVNMCPSFQSTRSHFLRLCLYTTCFKRIDSKAVIRKTDRMFGTVWCPHSSHGKGAGPCLLRVWASAQKVLKRFLKKHYGRGPHKSPFITLEGRILS